jgi:mono/diheme cytochrome c family protein
VRKIIPSPQHADASKTALPAEAPSLAELGCVARGGPRAPPPNMISYEINQRPWEDDTETVRFMTLGAIDPFWGVDMEALAPPRGSILMKTYLMGDRPIETQMLVRRDDGAWNAFDYLWNDEGSDAFAVSRATAHPVAADRTWQLPGPQGCEVCHNLRVGVLRGFAISQLNRQVDGENQIARLESLGTLVWPWKGGEVPRLPALDDARCSLEDRARAYLHVNCAHCHQPGGQAGAVTMDLRRETPLALTRVCGEIPHVVLPGHDDARLIAPGDSGRSLVSARMHAEGVDAMPPQRRRIDSAGVELVDAWIRSLTSCP